MIHLYILSDDEIKEGDYFIITSMGVAAGRNEILQCSTLLENKNIKTRIDKGSTLWNFHKSHLRKIIATTDSSLIKEFDYTTLNLNTNQKHRVMQTGSSSIARLSDNFIQEYCKIRGINEVIVEYIKDYTRCKADLLSNHIDKYQFCKKHQKNSVDCEGCPTAYLIPKITSDNTIVISKIKDSWSREEVIKLCKDSMMFGNSCASEFLKTSHIDYWINEKLN